MDTGEAASNLHHSVGGGFAVWLLRSLEGNVSTLDFSPEMPRANLAARHGAEWSLGPGATSGDEIIMKGAETKMENDQGEREGQRQYVPA